MMIIVRRDRLSCVFSYVLLGFSYNCTFSVAENVRGRHYPNRFHRCTLNLLKSNPHKYPIHSRYGFYMGNIRPQ